MLLGSPGIDCDRTSTAISMWPSSPGQGSTANCSCSWQASRQAVATTNICSQTRHITASDSFVQARSPEEEDRLTRRAASSPLSTCGWPLPSDGGCIAFVTQSRRGAGRQSQKILISASVKSRRAPAAAQAMVTLGHHGICSYARRTVPQLHDDGWDVA